MAEPVYAAPIIVSPEVLEQIVAAWEPDTDPLCHYRWPTCARCARTIAGPMYHCWLPDRVREIHLCFECGQALDERG